jgi:hypothetical protein
MRKITDLHKIIFEYLFFYLLLSLFAFTVPLLYHEIRWDIPWDNVPDDIRSNYAKFRCMTVAKNGDLGRPSPASRIFAKKDLTGCITFKSIITSNLHCTT